MIFAIRAVITAVGASQAAEPVVTVGIERLVVGDRRVAVHQVVEIERDQAAVPAEPQVLADPEVDLVEAVAPDVARA